MSHPLVQAQAEKTDLEQALAWLRGEGRRSGRREAEIAARAVERGLAEIKQRLSGELSETAGYVVYWRGATHRVFTGVRGELWSGDLRLAERFADEAAAEARLRVLRAAMNRLDRYKLTVEPLAKLIHTHRKAAASTTTHADITSPTPPHGDPS
ncbi:MAG: hypothetical protein JNM76_14740 [Betaproteobacteria bacterium]|nr:hypothetical protein [Betaproteobacteria bacterium]